MRGTRLKRLGKRKLRELEAIRLFREAVLQRDSYTCQRCGKPGDNAHHLRAKGRNEEDRHHPDNGVCLCWDCHIIQVHGHQGDDWRDWIG